MGQTARAILTPLAIAVLGLLDERPMHPYEMYQLLIARREDLLVKVRPGSLYHVVGRLADDEMVAAEGIGRAGNRPERTTYRITESGRTALRERIADLLRTPVQEYPIFRVALAEAHTLPQEQVVALLDARVESLTRTRADMDVLLDWARSRDIPRRYFVVLEYILATIQADITWIEDFAAQIGSGAVPWEQYDPDTGERITDDHAHEWPSGDSPEAAPRPHRAARS
ncbi:PadR family transcriptional regulator [Nocardia alba]|uniref:PadR family transcriptional regulator n=1 Tax=Nocardia alba TaxID=225051 RepID=A0A4R1G3I7_9NOCA|nr:PadR family transcriptional regulator [Nocardia alba]TCJ99758.1 PadR family transcriptional regulator [Nocardia alba]